MVYQYTTTFSLYPEGVIGIAGLPPSARLAFTPPLARGGPLYDNVSLLQSRRSLKALRCH